MENKCPQCRKPCDNPADILSIRKTGMCLLCDHVLGEILEDQLLESELECDDEV